MTSTFEFLTIKHEELTKRLAHLDYVRANIKVELQVIGTALSNLPSNNNYDEESKLTHHEKSLPLEKISVSNLEKSLSNLILDTITPGIVWTTKDVIKKLAFSGFDKTQISKRLWKLAYSGKVEQVKRGVYRKC